MKESEFIELLNLYVDHEISAQGSARLEAEVASNSARRKTYRQYCMMHKACDALAAQYRDQQAETPHFAFERQSTASWGWGAGLLTGGFLAAACLALAFVVHVRQANRTDNSLANHPMPAVAAAEPTNFRHAPPAHLSSGELQPVLNTRDWTNPSPVQNESLAWMNKVELAPIQLQRTSLAQLPIFQAAPLLLTTGSGPTQVNAPAQDAQIERVAFQFQR